MAKKIYKYPLTKGSSDQMAELQLPKGAKLLHFSIQNRTPYIWAEVNPENETEPRVFRVVATGEPIPFEHYTHINTYERSESPFVWHLIEKITRQQHELNKYKGNA